MQLRDAVAPATRTTGYYAKSWRRYLGSRDHGELPIVRPTVALAGQAFRDEIVIGAFRIVMTPPSHADVTRMTEETRRAAEFYQAQGWLPDPVSYFPAPPPVDGALLRSVDRGPRYLHLSFASDYEPHAGEPGRDRWLGYEANRTAHAWILRHETPRPWVIPVHGTRMGRPGLDMMLFRAGRLHKELGLNVAMPVLPLHGPRRQGLPKQAGFPGVDTLDNIHAAAQSVWDIRRIIAWIREQDPDAQIGMTSISLGGYVSALVASLEDDLSCAVLGVPAVDLVGLLSRHGPPPSEAEQVLADQARAASHVVSPLSLTPKVPAEGRFIFAGLADRLVHPRDQVERIWQHWGRPEINWYRGGHTGFFRSQPVQQFIEGALVQAGLIESWLPALDRQNRR